MTQRLLSATFSMYSFSFGRSAYGQEVGAALIGLLLLSIVKAILCTAHLSLFALRDRRVQRDKRTGVKSVSFFGTELQHLKGIILLLHLCNTISTIVEVHILATFKSAEATAGQRLTSDSAVYCLRRSSALSMRRC